MRLPIQPGRRAVRLGGQVPRRQFAFYLVDWQADIPGLLSIIQAIPNLLPPKRTHRSTKRNHWDEVERQDVLFNILFFNMFHLFFTLTNSL
jgi:hypothetical protein